MVAQLVTSRVVLSSTELVSFCLSLLGNSSVNTFPEQWKIVGGITFSMQTVLSQTKVNEIFTELLVHKQF
jgi:hypothetical protein